MNARVVLWTLVGLWMGLALETAQAQYRQGAPPRQTGAEPQSPATPPPYSGPQPQRPGASPGALMPRDPTLHRRAPGPGPGAPFTLTPQQQADDEACQQQQCAEHSDLHARDSYGAIGQVEGWKFEHQFRNCGQKNAVVYEIRASHARGRPLLAVADRGPGPDGPAGTVRGSRKRGPFTRTFNLPCE